MPDEFVPLDTLKYTKYHRQLAAKSIINNANLKFIDNHRKELRKTYPDFATFNKNFVVPQSLVDDIMAEGKKQKIEPKDADELKRTLPYLETQLKALVARDLWDISEYFQVMNETNDIVRKALQVID